MNQSAFWKTLVVVMALFAATLITYRAWLGRTVPPEDPEVIRLLDKLWTPKNPGSSARPRVIILNLWAEWCAPCLQEIPELNRLQARYPRLTFLALTSNEAKRTAAFLQKQHLLFRYQQAYGQAELMQRITQLNPDPAGRMNAVIPTHLILVDNRIVYFASGAGKQVIQQLDSVLRRVDRI